MWTLECDGELFQHKKHWLMPDSQHLIGRTKSNPDPKERNFYGISNKSISRQHLILTVDPVEQGSSGLLQSKSKLTLRDCSKLGSDVDGEKLVQDSIILDKDEHLVRLGNYEHLLRIKWFPVVLTLTSLSRNQRESGLKSTRDLLEARDIKVTADIVIGKTTHVVASKRNTPAVLEGLVLGQFIVTEKYVDAIAKATTPYPRDGDEGSNLNLPLETDFDSYWPDPLGFIPPPGKEPVPRTAEYLHPNPARATIFRGYTFVFCSSAQFENLQAPITDAGGKAIHYEQFEEGKTRPEHFVAFVKSIGGSSERKESIDETNSVIVVRFATNAANADDSNWVTNFVQQSDLMLGQRSMVQNEFLDAVLQNDASRLLRALEDEPDITSAEPISSAPEVPSTEQTSPRTRSATTKKSISAADSTTTKSNRRRLRHGPVESKFTGFDDFESFPTKAIADDDDTEMREEEDDAARGQGSSNQASSGKGKKRAKPASDDDDISSLLPAAASMKRRRIDVDHESDGIINLAKHESPKAPRLFRKTIRREEVEIDVLKAARSRREKAEEEARLDDEALQEALDDTELQKIKDKLQIEEMSIKPKADAAPDQASGDRWDERWNGRKNFKKFRRRGEQQQPLRGHKVMVRLEVAKKKDFGIGEDYWLVADEGKASGSADRAPKTAENDEDLEEIQFSFASGRGSKAGVAEETTPAIGMAEVEEPIVSQPPRRTRATSISQTQSSGKKRASTSEVSVKSKRPAKKSKLVEIDEGSGGSEDELRFRRRR